MGGAAYGKGSIMSIIDKYVIFSQLLLGGGVVSNSEFL